jgi:hypothetical protein
MAKQENTNPMLKLFSNDLSKNLHSDFQTIFEDNNGNWAAIKPQLDKNVVFKELLPKLEFTHNLSVLSNNNEDFVAHFQQDNAINSLSDIALHFNRSVFSKAVKNTGIDINLVFNQVFQLAPTAQLVNMIKDPKVDFLNSTLGGQVGDILHENINVNLKTTSVYEIINKQDVFKNLSTDAQQPVTVQLKTLARLTALSQSPEVIPVLYNKNLHTSGIISAIPKSQFQAMMQDSDLDETQIEQIHYDAQNRAAQISNALLEMYQHKNGANFGIMNFK